MALNATTSAYFLGEWSEAERLLGIARGDVGLTMECDRWAFLVAGQMAAGGQHWHQSPARLETTIPAMASAAWPSPKTGGRSALGCRFRASPTRSGDSQTRVFHPPSRVSGHRSSPPG